MKGDFSRIRFTPDKQYTAVLEQQGRVALDADANEQCAIDEYLRRTETIDVVGAFGAPVNDAGFEITVSHGEILIGPGRYYVQGLMCENKSGLALGNQRFLIDPDLNENELLVELRRYEGQASIRVYLQVWQRLVTALDDPCLREPALGQADTTARLQTVWRVVAALEKPSQPSPGRLTPRIAATGVRADSPLVTARDSAPALSVGTESSVQPAGTSGGSDSGTISPLPLPIRLLDCCAQMYLQASVQSTGKLRAQTSGGSDTCGCQPIAAAGYRGLENQLYRVEIHKAGDETSATFKWSRENGSVVSAVLGVSGATVQLDSLGPDANLGFQPNQWVEVYDDSYLFGPTPNRPGEVYQIQSIDPASNSVTMYTPVMPVEPLLNARMRRWDQSGSSATSDGLPLAAGLWLDLENGIQITFAAGSYQSGDHWTIPARTASGQIEWPPCGSDGTAFQPPHSLRVYSAPLACIHWDLKKRGFYVEDCRMLFSPLTALTAPVKPQAIHVTGISWSNDDIITFDQLIAGGLTVTLDGNPTGPVSSATFVVSFEVPTLTNLNREFTASVPSAVFEALPSTILRDLVITDSLVRVKSNTILWQLPYLQADYLQRLIIQSLNERLLTGAQLGWFARARVRLPGSQIFSGSGGNQSFLDGQSYGQAAIRADGSTPRIDLQLPSGNEQKAGDFESWFYVAPLLALTSLTVNYPALTVIVNAQNAVTGVSASSAAGAAPQPVTPQASLTVNYPAVADTNVTLALTGTSGVDTVANIPSAVTIRRNTTNVSIPITVLSNPGAGTTLTFQITASVRSALGQVSQQTASFTVAGVQP